MPLENKLMFEAWEPDEEELEEAMVDDTDLPDSIQLYFREMSKFPLLTAEQEVALAKRIEVRRKALHKLEKIADDASFADEARQILLDQVIDGEEAVDLLASSNTRLVVSIAKRYLGQGLSFEDLIQEGNFGLMRAIYKFEYRKGNRFSTYATWWIRQAITRALGDQSRTIRVPTHSSELIRKIRQTSREFYKEHGRNPNSAELGEILEISAERVTLLLESDKEPLSLDSPVKASAGDDLSTLAEVLESITQEPIEEQLLHDETHEYIKMLLALGMLSEVVKSTTLTSKQSLVLRLRFGLMHENDEARTLEEVAIEVGVTRERVRQIEKDALGRLRRHYGIVTPLSEIPASQKQKE